METIITCEKLQTTKKTKSRQPTMLKTVKVQRHLSTVQVNSVGTEFKIAITLLTLFSTSTKKTLKLLLI